MLIHAKISWLVKRLLLVSLIAAGLLTACSPGLTAPTSTGNDSQKAPTREKSASGELLTYHVSGGVAGYCHKLSVFNDDHALFANECDKTQKEVAIEAASLEKIRALVGDIGAYTYKHPAEAGADGMAVEMQTFGATRNNSSPDEKKVNDLLVLLSVITDQAIIAK